MPVLKVQLNQETYEQLLTVASRDWRPPLWQAEWLLWQAIKGEYEASERHKESVEVGTSE